MSRRQVRNNAPCGALPIGSISLYEMPPFAGVERPFFVLHCVEGEPEFTTCEVIGHIRWNGQKFVVNDRLRDFLPHIALGFTTRKQVREGIENALRRLGMEEQEERRVNIESVAEMAQKAGFALPERGM